MIQKYLSSIGFASIILVAIYAVWEAGNQGPLVVESSNDALLAAVGTEVKASNLLLTPSPTKIPTSRPTPLPKAPTPTSFPTYSAEASPGLYRIPQYTPVPVIASTPQEVVIPPCDAVTPKAYADTLCKQEEIKEEG